MKHKIAIFLLSLISAACSPDYVIHTPEKIIFEQFIQDTAEEGDVWVDSFYQRNTTDGVDIIWLIDQSGSMTNDFEKIIAGIEEMLNSLPKTGWRLNILSTDPDSALRHNFFPIIPGDGILNLERLFSDMQNLGGAGEQGFLSVYNYINFNEQSDWWIRPESALLVVFVSDEEEQSGSYFPDALSFADWYSTIKPPGSVFISSIINVDEKKTLCPELNTSDIGHRYIEATETFSGSVIDICSDDWSQGVRDAARDMEPYDKLQLTHKPVVNSIRVFLDGLDTTSGWYYDAPTNSIIFTVIPGGGVLVEAGYTIEEFISSQSS